MASSKSHGCEALIFVPEPDRLRALCESITSVLERRQIGLKDLLDTLPAARERVFAHRCPDLASKPRG